MISDVKVSVDANDDSKLIVDYKFQPIQPAHYINMNSVYGKAELKTWQEMLSILYLRSSADSTDRIADITARMKQQWPGEYIVEEFYNVKLMRFDLRLKFEDPKKEMLWKIRNPE